MSSRKGSEIEFASFTVEPGEKLEYTRPTREEVEAYNSRWERWVRERWPNRDYGDEDDGRGLRSAVCGFRIVELATAGTFTVPDDAAIMCFVRAADPRLAASSMPCRKFFVTMDPP